MQLTAEPVRNYPLRVAGKEVVEGRLCVVLTSGIDRHQIQVILLNPALSGIASPTPLTHISKAAGVVSRTGLPWTIHDPEAA
ncbi:hypothetical protein WG219_05845 [Ectopseudomonas mendocina]|uniref:Uncharacterized protein n=1 Tax=Ectopseudomonas mendocina TaxID=300 RepID=A0ABZ2RIY5_ECTME